MVLAQRSRVSKEDILCVALALAQDRGIQHFSLSDVAKRLGIGASTVVRHFGSREQLCLAVIAAYRLRLHTHIARVVAQYPPGSERLIRLVEMWCHRSLRPNARCLYAKASTAFAEQPPSRVRDAFTAGVEQWRGVLRSSLTETLGSARVVEVDYLLLELQGLLLGFHHDYHFLGELTSQDATLVIASWMRRHGMLQ